MTRHCFHRSTNGRRDQVVTDASGLDVILWRRVGWCVYSESSSSQSRAERCRQGRLRPRRAGIHENTQASAHFGLSASEIADPTVEREGGEQVRTRDVRM